jgi:hypothetical protein
MTHRRRNLLSGAAAVAVCAGIVLVAPVSAVAALPNRPDPGRIDVSTLSSGGRAWFQGPQSAPERPLRATARIAFGSNVDANDPQRDLAAGQSETAIAATGSTVLAAWNNATGFLVAPSTDRRASLTGIGLSTDGARTFRDLIGLRNNTPNQQWFGDPTVVAIDAHHFAIGSLYLPANQIDCTAGPARLQAAVEILSISATGAVSLGLPVVAADGGDVCPLLNDDENDDPPDTAFIDKEWLSYDAASRRLAMSYTRAFFGAGGQSGAGQVELVRARVPSNPSALSAAAWSAPIVVWPEEPDTVNTGAYVALAPGGDAYVSWERNVDSNLFNGDPYVYIHAARIRPGDNSPVVGGPGLPRVVSLGQRNSNGAGGVKSLDAVVIAGYNRGTGQDFPRVAVNPALDKVLVVWNDASAHPLGDIWLRALPRNLNITGPISKVNDDNSFALHLFPAVSVRSDGSTSMSWYDRRIAGPNSSTTDYFGEIRATPTTSARDFRITTGSTDWTNTSSLITPNFGDYTDNASTGSTTYYTWSDGRLGIPQPFVDHR